MGLLTTPIAVTRLDAANVSDAVDFEAAEFRAIPPGSELRESVGFLPYEPGEGYEVGSRRFAFRVRIDRLRPDATAVRERTKELVRIELDESGQRFVGAKRRRELRRLAEEELIVDQSPRSTIIECCLDGGTIFVGTTAKNALGVVTQLLRRVGVETTYRLPWLEHGLPDVFAPMPGGDPAASIHGCHFLKALVGDAEFLVEPEAGRVRLMDGETFISLSGAVMNDLHHYLGREAEPLSAKMVVGDTRFTLEAPTYRLSGVRFPAVRNEFWTEDLDQRLVQIGDLFERLDGKFKRLMRR